MPSTISDPNRAELRIARLALDGGRYDEAEQLFESFAKKMGGPFPWVGLGSAKLGLLLQGQTTQEEVTTCFEIARRLSETESDLKQVELVAARRAAVAVGRLYKHLVGLKRAEEANRDKASLAVAAGGLSVLFGTNSSSFFGTLASYNIFDRSADAFESSLEAESDLETDVEKVETLIEGIVSFVRTFASSPDAEYREVLEHLEKLEAIRRGTHLVRPSDVPPATTPAQLPPEGLWHILIEEQTYSAPDFETLSRWIQEGRVPLKAHVWHPTLAGWTEASQISAPRQTKATASVPTTPGDWLSLSGAALWIALVIFGIPFFLMMIVASPFLFIPAAVIAVILLAKKK